MVKVTEFLSSCCDAFAISRHGRREIYCSLINRFDNFTLAVIY